MSSRQKSFFDQNHKRKPNGNWHGGYRNHAHDRNEREEDTRAPPPTKPAIAASAQAKSRLQAFKLGANSLASPARSDKENAPFNTMQTPIRKPGQAMTDGPPSTPAVRLPLSDLLGNVEDLAKRGVHKEDSPEEQLAWMPQHGMGNSDCSPAARRKRAHSSSPATSSQAETTAHFGGRKMPDPEQRHKALTTPKADPAADLWSRYNGLPPPRGATEHKAAPSLAHLLNDVSPQHLPRTPGGSIKGLRRWASCGTEFPESAAKRRRTNGAAEPLLLRERSDGARNPSRVGIIVEQIRANPTRPRPRHVAEEPSSTPPLPANFLHERAAVLVKQALDSTPSSRTASENADENHLLSHDAVQESQSSDYGDEGDFADLAYLMEKETLVNEQRAHSSRTGPDQDPIPQHDSMYNDHHENHDTTTFINTSSATQSVPLNAIQEEEDEFGADDEFTAEEFDAAMSQVEHSTAGRPQGTTARDSEGDQPTSAPSKLCNVTFSSDDDEFGGLDGDDEQYAAVELAATQAYRASGPSQGHASPNRSRTIQRYLVKSVVMGQYVSERGFSQDEKILLVEDEKSKASKAITLRQSWLDTHCNAGAYVHVVGTFSRTGQITIDDAANLLIVHPDHLVSSTAVADSFDCLRKAVLQDRVKATSSTSKATVYGTILHELFQVALQNNRWDVDWLHERLCELVVKFIEGLFEAGAKDTNEALEYTRSMLPGLKEWAQQFMRSTPGPKAKAQDRNGKTVNLSVSRLLDVEEHVWSPTYGLKGNIDATVEIAMQDDQGMKHLTVPFELKTGKYRSEAHRAQTALYTLLLSDRYDVDIQYGVLYYMEKSEVVRIPAIRNELRHMVMQRNELASYVRERLSLPPMLKNEFKCGRCYAKRSCFLYHKLSEDGTAETAGVGEKFTQMVSKLKPVHQDFFKKWDDLLTKEETEMFKFRRELWTMMSHERQKLGRCFAEVVIEPGTAYEDRDAQKINRFAYTFVKKGNVPGVLFTESQIVLGEPIVVSSEQGHFALANGYVTKVSETRISVAVDRRLHNARTRLPGFDETNNQTFAAIMDVDQKPTKGRTIDEQISSDVVYRLDKDEFSNGMATVRNNLLAIMDDEVYRSYELRQLIIENKEPVFKPSPTAYTLSGPQSQMQINSDQSAAIDKIMSAQEYALVLGMPGTGKTTTIAHIIRALVARGKSVLLTSYTHTAVDNILLKLRDLDTAILRLGVLAKIHPEVRDFAKLAALPRQSIEELEELYMTPQVVATTCLGINHQLFHKRVFDYCIVDEASQITLPVCLGPIRMARTFVLVGDHYQLPPLVQNKDAAEGGLDISLFKLLSDRHPSSVVSLEHQYRMCAEIMHLSNTLIYSGRLKCGNDAVANRTTRGPLPSDLQTFHSSTSLCRSPSAPTCQLAHILSPANKVIFANTDSIPGASESLAGRRLTNPYEASVVTLLTAGLLRALPPNQVGVITFYRSQLGLLRATVPAEVEMHTADKFQGRDKEVVVLSCVRSNGDGNVGDLLRDWRRLNVAITRARGKFILVGSRRTLEADELWGRLIRLVEEMGGLVELKEGLVGGHEIPVIEGTQRVVETKKDEPRKVLSPGKGVGNRGPAKRAAVKGEVVLKKRPVSQDIMNMIMG